MILRPSPFWLRPPVRSSNRAGAQTRNSSSKVQFSEAFVFPNECTNELMDVTDVTTVTCHDQQRADGRFIEKCEIRQDVTATGRDTGITWRGTGDRSRMSSSPPTRAISRSSITARFS